MFEKSLWNCFKNLILMRSCWPRMLSICSFVDVSANQLNIHFWICRKSDYWECGLHIKRRYFKENCFKRDFNLHYTLLFDEFYFMTNWVPLSAPTNFTLQYHGPIYFHFIPYYVRKYMYTTYLKIIIIIDLKDENFHSIAIHSFPKR